ncbi:hypothetical protein BS78_02G067500 [Paspalum vaginatum]|nr:hypothetical protein BS78_02G067500 [Paspalum vaginatum]
MQPGAVNQPSSKRSRAKKAAASEGGSHRQENFSIEEEKLLCSAFLYVSKDPIVGVNQSGESYWERIEKYFNDNNRGRPYRNSASLSKKWQKMSEAVSKFVGYKALVDRANPSGMTEQDRIKAAVAIFREKRKKPFKLIHCWEILCNERKWLDYRARNKKDDEDDSMEVSIDHANTSSEPAQTPQARPIGRDFAKKRRSSDTAYSNASSAFLEVMQQIGASRDKKMELLAAYMTARKEEREARKAEQEAHKAEMAAITRKLVRQNKKPDNANLPSRSSNNAY